MSNIYINPSAYILRILFFTNLLEVSYSYSIPYPLLIATGKRVSLLVAGTTLSSWTGTGFRRSILSQSVKDTRNLNLWILSSTCPIEFILRVCSYSAIEAVGLSFGHLNLGAVGIGAAGLRNTISNELAKSIEYGSA